jgi:AraC-like DNA-binding protein
MAEEKDDAHLVCASIKFGTGSRNPLANALPTMLIIKFSDSPSLRTTTELLFTEAFANDEGRAVVTNRLLDVFLVQLFRYVIAKKLINQGLLAGLTHPHLSKALRAIHSDPAHHWTLESLAEMTAMSRSKFAELFRAELGQPCGDYIVECRVSVAQNLLKRGKPVGWVANEVGYESASALARAFRKKVGQSPRQWLADNSGPGATI